MRISSGIFVCLVTSAVWKCEASESNNVEEAATQTDFQEGDILRKLPLHKSSQFHPPRELMKQNIPSRIDTNELKHVILVGGGSFSPPSIMHLRMFERARDHLEGKSDKSEIKHATRYEVVLGIMSPVNDLYGKDGLLSAEHRKTLAGLATHSSTWIKADPWEADQKHNVQTLDLLKHYRTLTEHKVMFLCGSDLLDSFNGVDKQGKPYWTVDEIREIIEDFGLVVLWRPGNTELEKMIEPFREEEVKKLIMDNLHQQIIIVNEWARVGISSTGIRNALKSKASIRYLVVDPVRDYIAEKEPFDFQQPGYVAPPPPKRARNLNIQEEAYGEKGGSVHEDDQWVVPQVSLCTASPFYYTLYIGFGSGLGQCF